MNGNKLAISLRDLCSLAVLTPLGLLFCSIKASTTKLASLRRGSSRVLSSGWKNIPIWLHYERKSRRFHSFSLLRTRSLPSVLPSRTSLKASKARPTRALSLLFYKTRNLLFSLAFFFFKTATYPTKLRLLLFGPSHVNTLRGSTHGKRS